MIGGVMRYLSLNEVLAIYQAVVKQSGGTYGIRDPGALQSALRRMKWIEMRSRLGCATELQGNLCSILTCLLMGEGSLSISVQVTEGNL
jgi:hypothetical protein